MAEADKSTYYIPEKYFTLLGQGDTLGSLKFKCNRCIVKTVIAASSRSRFNLRKHINSKHHGSIKEFDSLCQEQDGRKKRATCDGASRFEFVFLPL